GPQQLPHLLDLALVHTGRVPRARRLRPADEPDAGVHLLHRERGVADENERRGVASGGECAAELPNADAETAGLTVLVWSLERDDHHLERVWREQGAHSVTTPTPSGRKKRAKDRLAGAGISAH